MDPSSASTRGERESWSGSDAGGVSNVGAGNQAVFLQKVRESSEAIAAGDFRRAVALYTEAIALDPGNHILYTNRSAAHLKLGQLPQSLQDARKAKELNPKWAKAYLREGVALQQLGQHGEALAAFASGLAQDSGNAHLLSGLLDAALKSPLKGKLEPTFQQLEKLRLSRSPFVIISVIGQELLAAGHFSASVVMLESALKIGTCSLKLRGSVFSALSSAYWGLGNIDQALHHMQQDLAVAKSLGDQEGECRAYANLGSAYFTKGHYKEALCNHRYQLVIAMRLKDRQSASSALSSLGHVYTAIGDYPNALASHKQCVLLVKQSGDRLAEAREIGNVGAVYLAMGNFASAVECHHEHLKIAKALKNNVEEARAFSNLGSAYHYKRDYERAIMFHKQVLKIAESKQDKILESRAYAGLGHAARCSGDTGTAKAHHEKQLDNALQTRDKVAEGRACANLGIIFQLLGEHEAALKLHKVHLNIAKNLGDKASMGRAYGNIGNAYSSMGKHELAVKYHTQELTIASEVNDRHSESSTHGNLAVAYQALGRFDSALQHYLSHLNISRELKDTASEARALCNLGNFHCSRGSYAEAISYYEQYLILSQELHDSEGESKACFNLGYAHFNLGNFEEAVRYYEQDLSIAKEKRDKLSSARAYCNLGLAHKALHNLTEALECQKKCLSLMNALKNTPGKFRALGNIGDLMLKTGDVEEAIKIYWQQYQLAKTGGAKGLLATACGALGAAFRSQGQFDKALGHHTQELNLRQELNDQQGECRAHGNLGNVHMALGNFQNAIKCYSEQLERSREIGDSLLEAKACGNLGITRMNMGQWEEAIGMFEQQLAMLEQHYGSATLVDRGRAFGNLGDCYEALGDLEEAVKCHEQFLALAQQTGNLADQDRAYRGLGNAHRAIGNLQQALVCFEKRLVVAHELSSDPAKASAYGELGCLHSLLGNFEQAVSCLQHQLDIARTMGDRQCEGDAACGLGGVYQQMGEYETALEFHKLDLRIAEETGNTACQCRAFGNLGLSHESLGSYQEAVKCQEQHLSIAAQMNDKVAKTLAYSSLGRVHHALGHHTQAVQYLQQGLAIAEQLGRREDEAKIRHRLGLALWGARQLEECQGQLYKAADLFELIRRESQCSSDYKLSLFDLQTACYQALQRVLVALGRPDEALVVAERACTRAFIDLLLERQAGSAGLFNGTTMDLSPVTLDQIRSTVARQPALVLCFSIAAGFLYCWLLTPTAGVVHFRELNLAELEEGSGEHADTQSLMSVSNVSVLDQCVGQVREALGIDSHLIATSSGHRSNIPRTAGGEVSETDSESDDVFQHQLEELGDRLNAENDRTGFLRMVNRSHQFNASSYSLGSLASLSPSLAGSLGGMGGSQRKPSMRRGTASNSPLSRLYELLVQPLEEALEAASADGNAQDLVLVLQGDLYLIPFLLLRKDQTQPYLFERFNLIVVPSISALQTRQRLDKSGRPVIDCAGALVVGNPRLTPAIAQHWHLNEIPGSEYEARIVGELLACRPLIGAEASKGAVLHQIEQVEVIHFAAHISWKLSSIVLSPGELAATGQRFPLVDSDDSASDISCSLDGPALSEYLLTAADILNLKLHAKLVVLNSGYTDDRAGRINADGVIGLTRSLLSAGAQCVLLSLWPVPDQAAKLLMRTLYEALQEGQRVTQALSCAIRAVQTTKQFAHASNWGGWVLVGRDVKLNSKAALMGHAICQVLQAPAQCREALRVLLHLIEKSLQRLHQGEKKSMYTTIQSIENKVGAVRGWKDLLQAVGFRFEPATNGLPPAVFFPQSDLGDRLTQASASMQALLGLPPSSMTALSKFITNVDVGEALIVVMREILSKLTAKETGIEVQVNVQLWRAGGCHEFLASLGLDLLDVGQSHVTLRLSKQAVRRHLQFALQALVAVFDAQETPRSLSLDTSSSMESLSSSQSSSMSGSALGRLATPPMSPHGRNKSLFNPAEMEKMRNSARLQLSQGGGKRDASFKSSADPSIYLSHQSRIRSLYGGVPAEAFQLSSTSPSLEGGDSDSGASPSPRGSVSPCLNPSPSLSPSPRNAPPPSVAPGSGVSKMEKLRQHFEQLGQPGPGVGSNANSSASDVGSPASAGQRTCALGDVVDSSNGGGVNSGGCGVSEGARRLEAGSSSSSIASNSNSTGVSPQQNSGVGVGGGCRENGVSGGGALTQDSQAARTMAALSSQSRVRKPLRPGNVDLDESLTSEAEAEVEERWEEGERHSSGILNPQDLASKVLADVAQQRQAVESMQKRSFLQSQESSWRARNQHLAGGVPSPGLPPPALPPASSSLPGSFSPPDSVHGAPPATALTSVTPQRSWQLTRSPGSPGLTSPRMGNPPPYPGRPPVLPDRAPLPKERPPVPSKPSYVGSRGMGLTAGNMSGENSISSDNSEGADSNLQSSVSSGYHSENLATRDVDVEKQQQQRVERVTYTENFVNSTGPGGVGGVGVPGGPTFSSFRPYTLAPVQTNALTPRPESSNSTSSQYSTSSSARSVIYRPFTDCQGGVRGHRQSPRAGSTIPSILRQQGRGGAGREVVEAASVPGVLHDSKPLKKVSFSDSEERESSNTSFEDVTRMSPQQPLNYSIDSCPPSDYPPPRLQHPHQPGSREGAEYHSLTRGGFSHFSPQGEKSSPSVHIPMQDFSRPHPNSVGGGVGSGGLYGQKTMGVAPGPLPPRNLGSQGPPRTLYLEGEGKRSQVLQSSKC